MKSTTNVFSKGLTTDLHPMSVGRDQLTDALNATFVTYNGNELMLQNDMGNSRIQDRITGSIMGLKEGFIPLAMKEHGGVLYIASYNPQTKTSELGSIPSPLFDYTSYIPSDDTDCGVALLDNYTTPESPIILNLDNDTLFYPGDAIKCGLLFDGEMPNLKRSAYIKSTPSGEFKMSEVVYPYISTREKPGLLTLHALAIPSNSSEIIDLDLHKLEGLNKVSKQWFFDSSNQSSSQDVDLIIYPNIQSGQLAVMPVLQTISEVRVLTNTSTGKFEPYYIYQDAVIITVYFSKIKKVQSAANPTRKVVDECEIKINEETYQVSTLDKLQLSYITDQPIIIQIDNIDPGINTKDPDKRTVIINGVDTSLPENANSWAVTTTRSINIEINDKGWFKNQNLPLINNAL